MRTRASDRRAFTVLELLVVVSIIMVTAGIVFAVMGPVREKVRQTVCTSNLRQTGIAVRMYCADYGGEEVAEGPHAAADLGLPTLVIQLDPYLKNKGVLHCPDEDWAAILGPWAAKQRYDSSYCWVPSAEDEPPIPFSEKVRRRGPELPVAICLHHDHERDQPESPMLVIVLRLNGSVGPRRVSRQVGNGWEY